MPAIGTSSCVPALCTTTCGAPPSIRALHGGAGRRHVGQVAGQPRRCRRRRSPPPALRPRKAGMGMDHAHAAHPPRGVVKWRRPVGLAPPVTRRAPHGSHQAPDDRRAAETSGRAVAGGLEAIDQAALLGDPASRCTRSAPSDGRRAAPHASAMPRRLARSRPAAARPPAAARRATPPPAARIRCPPPGQGAVPPQRVVRHRDGCAPADNARGSQALDGGPAGPWRPACGSSAAIAGLVAPASAWRAQAVSMRGRPERQRRVAGPRAARPPAAAGRARPDCPRPARERRSRGIGGLAGGRRVAQRQSGHRLPKPLRRQHQRRRRRGSVGRMGVERRRNRDGRRRRTAPAPPRAATSATAFSRPADEAVVMQAQAGRRAACEPARCASSRPRALCTELWNCVGDTARAAGPAAASLQDAADHGAVAVAAGEHGRAGWPAAGRRRPPLPAPRSAPSAPPARCGGARWRAGCAGGGGGDAGLCQARFARQNGAAGGPALQPRSPSPRR